MSSRLSAAIGTDSRDLRILLVRLSSIGDVLMTSPVPQVLRDAFPHAHIAWLVGKQAAPIVAANPCVDEVIVPEREDACARFWREKNIPALIGELRAFGRELRSRQFSLAIDFQGLLKSGLLTWLSGAPIRIGPSPAAECNHLFMTHRAPRPRHTTRLTQANLAMLAALGLHPAPHPPVLQVPSTECTAAHAFLGTHGLLSGSYIACIIGTSKPQKDWPLPRWGDLADLMHRQSGLRTVFIGGANRRADTLRLLESCRSAPVCAVGHTSLLQAVAILQDAVLVIGGDTGLTYAGLATDTPTVALYGSTDPTWLAEEPCVTVCFHPLPCSPCVRRVQCRDYECMQIISVREVADTACRFLERLRITA